MHAQTAQVGSLVATASTPGQAWYENYLKSPHWIAVRRRKIEDAGYQCERCGEYGRRTPWRTWIGLHVHHLTYERVWNERMDDLEVLCRPCHEDAHGSAVVDDDYREQVRRSLSRRIAGRVITEYHIEEWDHISTEVAAWDAIVAKAEGSC